jgi:hypothetical protein
MRSACKAGAAAALRLKKRRADADNDDLPRPAAGRVADEPNKKQTMRLRKTEWMGVAVVAGSIACFGGWLQSEMTRAAFARTQRDAPDSHGACAGMSARDAEMLGKGELWCGAIGAGRAESLGKT